MESDEHIYRCVDILQNDKNISEQTIILMFLVYKDLIIKELKENVQNRHTNTKRSAKHVRKNI